MSDSMMEDEVGVPVEQFRQEQRAKRFKISRCTDDSKVNKTVGEQLFDYQVPHVETMLEIFSRRMVALDSSETGTGKSFAAFGIAENIWSTSQPNSQTNSPNNSISTSQTINSPTNNKPKIAIVCPKPIYAEFCRLAKKFEPFVEVVFVCNLELLVLGRYRPWSDYREQEETVNYNFQTNKPDKLSLVSRGETKTVPCPYVERYDIYTHSNNTNNKNEQETNKTKYVLAHDKEQAERLVSTGWQKTGVTYRWNLPNNTLLIFDEAHKNKNADTCYFILACSAVEQYRRYPIKQCPVRILLCTATSLENGCNAELVSLLYLLQLIQWKRVAEVKKLLHQTAVRELAMQRDGKQIVTPYTDADINMRVLHYILYRSNKTRVASRMLIAQAHAFKQQQKIKEAMVKGDLVAVERIKQEQPVSSQALSQAYQMSAEAEQMIQKATVEAMEAVQALRLSNNNASSKKSALAKLQAARQVTELYKVDTIDQLAVECYEQGYSVVIFFNFKKSVYRMQSILKDKIFEPVSIVIGGQSTRDRDCNVQMFQKDKARVLVTTIASGGASISLHDTIGTFPRFSIISPPISATQLCQCLGRIDRSGAKTGSEQRLVFCKNTIEERIAHMLNDKIRGMDLLNNGFVVPRTWTLFDFAHSASLPTVEPNSDDNNNQDQEDNNQQQDVLMTDTIMSD